MRKWIFGFLIILIIALVVFWLNKNKMETIKICFTKAELSSGENCFLAEVAKTKAQRTKGLMFRENLAQNKAMLFVFSAKGGSAPGGEHSFWMKNCKIPLDIIWLDENYKVVAIKPNNQPCKDGEECSSINPNVLARYVLEINAGLAGQIGLAEGDYLTRKGI